MTALESTAPAAGPTRMAPLRPLAGVRGTAVRGTVAAAAATTTLGLSFPISALLVGYPVLPAQSVRYLIAAATLLLVAWLRGVRVVRPTGRELLFLVALAATGSAGFNVLLLAALEHAEPSAVGVVVGCTPVVLALLGPVLARRRPSGRLVVAAAVAACGAGLVQGGGTASAAGLVLALGTLACETAYSLLAVPILPRLGPLLVSLYSCALAALLLAAAAPFAGAQGDLVAPTASQALIVVYLGVVLTAGAFLWYYTGVALLGVERAGLFGALIPVATLVGGLAIGAETINLAKAAGTGLVALALVAGLVAGRRRAGRAEGARAEGARAEGRAFVAAARRLPTPPGARSAPAAARGRARSPGT